MARTIKISALVFALVVTFALGFRGVAGEPEGEEECGAACKAKNAAVKAKDWTVDKGKKGYAWTKDKAEKGADAVKKDEGNAQEDKSGGGKTDKPGTSSKPPADKAKDDKGSAAAESGDKSTGEEVKEGAVKAKDWTVDKGKKAYGWGKDKVGSAGCAADHRECVKKCGAEADCQAMCDRAKAKCLKDKEQEKAAPEKK